MIWLILYIIGYIGSYYIGRKLFRKSYKENYAWIDVYYILLSSIFIVIQPLLYLTHMDIKLTKPPKWL